MISRASRKHGFNIRMLRAYVSLFDQPGTKGFVVAGFVSRLTSSMVFVSLILAITERGGGYATAGAVIAALTLAAGLALPVFGRLIDRYGQHAVLVPMALAFGVLMLLLTVAVEAREQEWLLVVLAAAAGGADAGGGPTGAGSVDQDLPGHGQASDRLRL